MTAAAGPYLAACLLLVVAGMGKVREPTATQRALAGLGRHGPVVPSRAVQAGGVAEVVLGMAALASSTAGPAAAVALCYLAFAGFVTASLAGRGGSGGCGCFGGAGGDVPVGRPHLAANLLLAGAALAVAADGGLHGPPVERAAVSVLAAGLAWVVYLVLVPLARLMVAVDRARR